MAKVVVIVDSETGRLVDVAGNGREGGRYARFVQRMLSLDENPVLNYGANGGKELEISCNGLSGEEVKIKADLVSVSGVLSIGGENIEYVIGQNIDGVLKDKIKGTDGEIDISHDKDLTDGRQTITISLGPSVKNRISELEDSVGNIGERGYVTKEEIASAIDGLRVYEDDSLDQVKTTLGLLIRRLAELSGAEVPPWPAPVVEEGGSSSSPETEE